VSAASRRGLSAPVHLEDDRHVVAVLCGHTHMAAASTFAGHGRPDPAMNAAMQER
jgi:hypothetical protein